MDTTTLGYADGWFVAGERFDSWTLAAKSAKKLAGKGASAWSQMQLITFCRKVAGSWVEVARGADALAFC